MVFRLIDDLIFPDPSLAEPDGLLAIGGDLSPERLILAYQTGIFPWFSEGEPILWYAPHRRCVIFPGRIKISKSMRKFLRAGKFTTTINTAFDKVIAACAEIPRQGQRGTWITNTMQAAYIELHRRGFAHSIEIWEKGELVGGLYGVKINKVFCGESMFSKATNASKVALIHLAEKLDYKLIDCQLPNDHLMRMGAEMIGREEYTSLLQHQDLIS